MRGTHRPLPAASQRVGESNTKAGLIEPIIAALGWDVLDPDEVHREYRRRPADNPVDYALLLSRTPRLFIEAKGLGGNINDPTGGLLNPEEAQVPARPVVSGARPCRVRAWLT